MTEALAQLLERSRRWAEDDPDPLTQNELIQALRRGDEAFIRTCFEVPLSFGTAGLRASVGPGPGMLNEALLRKLGWALGDYLAVSGLCPRGVVVGCDARPESARFARILAETLSSVCAQVWLFDVPLPTPLVAYAARKLQTGAAVVVTASHNPAGESGVKVYDDEGIQIVSPWDVEIQQRLGLAPPARAIRLDAAHVTPVPCHIIQDYFSELRRRVRLGGEGALRVAYTPLSGVGLASLQRALEGSSVKLHVVPSQGQPDGQFLGTPFPNPEHPRALSPLLRLASEVDAHIALANDPDADRLAVALPDGQAGWLTLTGDEIGLLLADAALERATEVEPVVVTSVVSTPAVEALLALVGGRVIRTLTGFKWIARALYREPKAIFGFEEALGYCFQGFGEELAPLDKDGIAAAMHFLAIAQREGGGAGVLRKLAQIAERVGLWVSVADAVTLFDVSAAKRTMTQLRHAPPSSLGGSEVVSVCDFSRGAEERPAVLGAANLMQYDAEDGTRVLVRPSGTEPKLKIYVHRRVQLSPADSFLQQRRSGIAHARRISAELCKRIQSEIGA